MKRSAALRLRDPWWHCTHIAMGANRGRLLWASLSETVLLAVPGAALGLLLSQWVVDAMIGAFPPGSLPYWLNFGIDARVMLFAAGAAVFTILVVGLLPALRTVRPEEAHDKISSSQANGLRREAREAAMPTKEP